MSETHWERFVEARADAYGPAEVALELIAFPEWASEVRKSCDLLDRLTQENSELRMAAEDTRTQGEEA